jgi:hypothetical protein
MFKLNGFDMTRFNTGQLNTVLGRLNMLRLSWLDML